MNIQFKIAATAAALSVSAVAQGGVVNGDFENGGAGWSETCVPPTENWHVTFPPTGGHPDGYARIDSPFGNSAGEMYILQVFVVGNETDTVELSLDLRSRNIDANPDAGRVRLLLDNELIHVEPGEFLAPWVTRTFLIPGGFHSISMGLEVDAGNNGYRGEFDNLTATVVVSNPPGACCIEGGCLELSFEGCTSVQGTYQGNETECATVSCPPPCPSDGDDSGEVDFIDLLNLLRGWGVCP